MLALKEFVDCCASACQQGTFITPKHYRANLGTPHRKGRSVVCMSHPEMESYLHAGNYIVKCYDDKRPGNSPQLYVIEPNDPGIVAGSGVPQYSTTPTHACDSFPVPSGFKQGFHVYAETRTAIKALETDGKLVYRGILT